MEKKIIDIFHIYPIWIDYFYILSFVLFPFVFFAFVYLFFKFPFKHLKIPSLKKKEKIEINFKNPKETAYRITFLIQRFETPYNKELLKRLEKYKYRKEVKDLDKKTVSLIKKFLIWIERK